jgi:hypothetical protein
MKVFLSCCFFILSGSCFGQSFPSSFIGNWEGTLCWYQQGKQEPKKVKMRLNIQPTDTADHYTWQIVYGENAEDNRPYLLKPVDKSAGHWVIDERSGIVLDQYLISNKFGGAFTVGNSTIINHYWRKGKKLYVEFYSITAESVSKTGGTSADVPPVSSYGVKSYQLGVLKKK